MICTELEFDLTNQEGLDFFRSYLAWLRFEYPEYFTTDKEIYHVI